MPHATHNPLYYQGWRSSRRARLAEAAEIKPVPSPSEQMLQAIEIKHPWAESPFNDRIKNCALSRNRAAKNGWGGAVIYTENKS